MLPVDRLSTLLTHFRVSARLSFAGPMCGRHVFPREAGKAYLHLLRQGQVEVQHPGAKSVSRRMCLSEPCLLLYPRPFTHHFINPPRDGSDFTCAEIDFEGGALHPIVQALPDMVMVRMADVGGLQACLDLLFAETEQVRCGHLVLASRLFEVLLIQLLRWLMDHPAQANVRNGLLMGLSSPQLAKALTAMHEAPGSPWTVDSLAACSGMSRTAFAMHFKQAMGRSPAQYLTDWRLSLAQARLRQGASLKVLASQLGYSSPSALTRAFSQRLGLSPRQWLAG